VLAAYAFGLLGYSAFHLLTRASYAMGDMAMPTRVNAGVAAVALTLMATGYVVASGGDRVVALGLAHSVAVVLGGGTALVVLARRLHAVPPWGALGRTATCSAASGLTAWAVSELIGAGTRVEAALAVMAGSAAAAAVYLAAQRLWRSPELAALVGRAAS
jgi:peptidoglycan biosynthesis protein MviN/MurJ (putative lipid II flippase)